MPARGFKKQFCNKGHDTFITGRHPSNGRCIACAKEYYEAHKQKSPDKIEIPKICVRCESIEGNRWYHSIKGDWSSPFVCQICYSYTKQLELKNDVKAYELSKKQDRAWREANPDKIKENHRKYYEENLEYCLQKSKDYRDANPEYVHEQFKKWARTFKGRFKTLKGNAKSRNLEVGITFEEYIDFVCEAVCFYCEGSLPPAGCGIDRLDNSKGYIKDNMVPCCSFCNDLRGDQLTPEETKVAVDAIKQFRLNRILNNAILEVK